jgi:ketosteroid isomerase-like protein
MGQENVEVVRAVIEGWLKGDPAALELIATDVVYVAPPTQPGGKTYHGHEGVMEWVVDWRQEWTDYELELERVEDLGDQVMTVERNHATGKRSGVQVDMRTFSIWTLRNGKVVRWEGFVSEEDAIAAAGPRE